MLLFSQYGTSALVYGGFNVSFFTDGIGNAPFPYPGGFIAFCDYSSDPSCVLPPGPYPSKFEPVFFTIPNSANGIQIAWNNVSFSEPFTVTPLPGALPLFVTGLGVLGLLGWRRKQKVAARRSQNSQAK
jgi:hypothetical protein